MLVGGQGRCERRSEIFCENSKKRGGRVGGVMLGGSGYLKHFLNIFIISSPELKAHSICRHLASDHRHPSAVIIFSKFLFRCEI